MRHGIWELQPASAVTEMDLSCAWIGAHCDNLMRQIGSWGLLSMHTEAHRLQMRKKRQQSSQCSNTNALQWRAPGRLAAHAGKAFSLA